MRPPRVENPVFLLDYDGTLAEIAPRPEEARPYSGVPELLAALARRYPVYLVTGRRVGDLERLLPVPGLRAYGVHGLEEGTLFGQVRARVPEAALVGLELARERLPRLPGLRVEDKELAIALHYRGAPDEAGLEAALRRLAEELPPGLEALWGKKVLEIRPRGFGKGRVAREIAGRFPDRTPVVLGDDATDEEMFRALPEAVTVKVGPGPTAARYRLPDVASAVGYLREYLEDHEEEHP